MNLIFSELGVGADNRRCVVTEAGDEDFSLAHRAGTARGERDSTCSQHAREDPVIP